MPLKGFVAKRLSHPLGDFSSSNVGLSPTERGRGREIEGADKTDLGGRSRESYEVRFRRKNVALKNGLRFPTLRKDQKWVVYTCHRNRMDSQAIFQANRFPCESDPIGVRARERVVVCTDRQICVRPMPDAPLAHLELLLKLIFHFPPLPTPTTTARRRPSQAFFPPLSLPLSIQHKR